MFVIRGSVAPRAVAFEISVAVVGTAIYYAAKGEEIWRWWRAWVRIGNEVIDGNVDCLAENPLVSKAVSLVP